MLPPELPPELIIYWVLSDEFGDEDDAPRPRWRYVRRRPAAWAPLPPWPQCPVCGLPAARCARYGHDAR